MRGKKIVVLLLVLMVAVVLFFGGQTESDGNYALYFLAEPEYARGSDAVKVEYCDLTLPEDAVEAARMVLERYWAGPQSSGLKTPLPAGLQLQDVQFGGGRLQVDVSPQYRTLSGIDLTLADSCLTMTLAQLDGVYAVTVTVNGRPLEYRSEQELRLRDMLLSSQEELVGTVDATLWFADENGGLVSELRRIPVYEGKTRAESVVDALLGGPEKEGLHGLIPAEYEYNSLRVEDGICYVNLSAEQLPVLAGGEEAALQALANSLCSLDTVHTVRYLVDGEAVLRYGVAVIENSFTAEK
ncbi:MAG: GerMN domain-containing protein [Oscillospiraceae bacterium]|nr:GerMN domain-containing protein [Oscillospiraceae bacterium]